MGGNHRIRLSWTQEVMFKKGSGILIANRPKIPRITGRNLGVNVGDKKLFVLTALNEVSLFIGFSLFGC